jgi:very-short-patch-repair endonuclease
MPHDEVSKIQRDRAKRLRREMTRAETLLWRHLKADRLAGLGFRRQTPMDNYIADFVAHSCKLVVEIDGESHDFESGSATMLCAIDGLNRAAIACCVSPMTMS